MKTKESAQYIIVFVISLAMFMEAIDSTIINTAIPAMSQILAVNPIDLKIALISYLLSLAIFIPISGWIADKFGIKRVFISAIFVFTLSSAWCGDAHTLSELVLARIIQGLGGSLMLPVGRLILLKIFARHEVIMMMTRVVMIASLGMMLGPVLGGYITHYFSWRWIFWVNVPVGLLTLLITYYWIPDFAPKKVHSLDKLGFVLFGTSLAAFTFGLSAFSETAIQDRIAVTIMIFAVCLLIIYVYHSRRLTHPIVKTELFAARTFRISVIGNLISRLGFGGIPFLLPLLLQIALGYSALLSGLLLAPTAIGVLLVKLLTIRLLRFFGYKKLLIGNTLLVALSISAFTIIDAGTSPYVIAILTLFYGFLISLQYSSMNSMAYSDLIDENLSAATSIMSTLQQLAQSLGVGFGALFIRFFSKNSSEKFLLTINVFHHTFLTMSILTLFSTFIFLYLKQNDGHQMIHSQKAS